MIEIVGDLWTHHYHNASFLPCRPECGTVAITTNGFVKQNGTCVMGRGVAYQAACRFPSLPKHVGSLIKKSGLQVEYIPEYNLLIFPVKYVWWDPADITLIIESARQTVTLIDSGVILQRIYMPRPGCGNGKLRWEVVRSVLEPILRNKVTIVNQ